MNTENIETLDRLVVAVVQRPELFPNKLDVIKRVDRPLSKMPVNEPEQDFYMGLIVTSLKP